MTKIKVHEHGYVELLDHMGSDEDIVDAARISYDRRGKTQDRTLLRFLLRHKHTSPFEMAELKFELKIPMFVARQWVRHRTASMNEVSARYTQLPNEMFIPEGFPVQSTDNKQGRKDEEPFDNLEFGFDVQKLHTASYDLYERMLGGRVSREIARGVLPLNTYTKFVWKMDLHNLMHFLNLRLDPHAQQEIRDYAQVIENIIAELFPICHEAFVDYVRDSYLCSRMEVDALCAIIDDMKKIYKNEVGVDINIAEFCMGMSQREVKEFKEKFLI